MAASKRSTFKRPASALGSYMHITDVRADVRVVDYDKNPDVNELTSRLPEDPVETTFGVSSVSLHAQHRFLNKHWMHMGCQLNSRMPLHDSHYSPERRWRFLIRYLMDFVYFVTYDRAASELTLRRVGAYNRRKAILCDDDES